MCGSVASQTSIWKTSKTRHSCVKQTCARTDVASGSKRPGRRPKVAILGGGMGSLSTAWELSRSGWTNRFESITIYQRGARLGGKAASSRGSYGRIEEHGLHLWMGYYDNAFRLIRE